MMHGSSGDSVDIHEPLLPPLAATKGKSQAPSGALFACAAEPMPDNIFFPWEMSACHRPELLPPSLYTPMTPSHTNEPFSMQGPDFMCVQSQHHKAQCIPLNRYFGIMQASIWTSGASAIPERHVMPNVLYVNKWYTFAACALLQLLMGVQYCFPCVPPS